MSWTEQEHKTRTSVPVSKDRASELDKEKASSLPTIQKESEEAKPFDPMKFQPVKSPDIYEAEFANKNSDVIFHFWPWNYHLAEREGKTTPKFKSGFEAALRKSMAVVFQEHRLEFQRDDDVGAWFVRAKGWGENQFSRELSIKACEALHKALGGKDS